MQFLPMAEKESSEKVQDHCSGEIIEIASFENKNVSHSEVCCGGPPPPPSNPFEKPGYKMEPFVTGFVKGDIDYVPLVASRLSLSDQIETLRTRIGPGRDDYKEQQRNKEVVEVLTLVLVRPPGNWN